MRWDAPDCASVSAHPGATRPCATHRLPADQTPHRLDAIRVRYSNCYVQNVVIQINSAPGVELGANGQPGSMAIWEHLDVTHETADCARGECPKFSTLRHYQSWLPARPLCGATNIQA